MFDYQLLISVAMLTDYYLVRTYFRGSSPHDETSTEKYPSHKSELGTDLCDSLHHNQIPDMDLSNSEFTH